ncbi:MAG: PilC/PilY family type IV pilus protein, partial [Rhodocyclaceae bacterium]|nr:PilC/PilY family type IV pilus protein [Rhodocyclaceae bacterium]
MNPNLPSPHRIRLARLLVATLVAQHFPLTTQAAPLALSQVPLFVTTSTKANVLLILDNSNSMDEAPDGSAAGSNSAASKSEIARSVARALVSTYTGKINMGLMAYKQGTLSSHHLHNSPYDVSYNPANYNASFAGARESTTKRFRTPNPSDPGNYIYYNVNLPFYSSSNQGNAFCYSPTAQAFNNGENPGSGPWDSYRCFTGKTGASDSVVSPLPGGGIKSSETTRGYSGLIGTYTFHPTDSDLAQGILDFGKLMAWTYVGKTWFNNTSPGRGYLYTPVADLTSTQASTLNTKLACNIPSPSAPCTSSGIPNAGLTPIEGTLLSAKDYFAGTLASGEGGPAAAPPQSCGKNFVVLLTDGLPSTDKNGNLVANPATALAAAATAAGQLKSAKVETYVVGFALPTGVDASTLNTIAAAGGTGTAYLATDSASLTTALNEIFSDILAKTGSAAAVATNSTALLSNSAIFQAKFNSGDWSGRLLAYPLGSNGSIAASPSWMAGSSDLPAPSYYVALPAANSRAIITTKSSTGNGIPFRWPVNAASPTSSELDVAQTTALGSANVLNYLRGDDTHEGTGTGQYRPRPAGKLGDIVNSSPVYVAKPNLGYPDNFEGAAYSAFRTAQVNRTPMVYAGANDGMLHAFKASDGTEKLAFVPKALYSRLTNLSAQAYAHRYYVDGSPTVADAYLGSAWKTILVGGLNGGGQGIYALDVTSPSSFSESNASTIVKWEFTDANDADLGYTYSQPVIGRLKNGKWAAIFGNGYNNTEADGNASTTGRAYLFIVDLADGSLLAKLDTKAGSATTPNGLASPAAVDMDGDNIVDYVYAGDLRGNLWKFDLTGNSAGSWKVAYGTTGSPQPLYTAVDGGGTAQPITVRPAVGLHPSQVNGLMVYFGTGKYIETGDNVTTGAQTQTFYGIWDKDATVTSGRSSLQQQTVEQ